MGNLLPDYQDLQQELELAKLEGIDTPSASLILKRMQGEENTAELFDDEAHGSPSVWSQDPLPHPAVTDALLSWAMGQSDWVEAAIWDFLEEPTHEALEPLLATLAEEGVVIQEINPAPLQTVTALIRRQLPASAERLTAIVQSTHSTKRPAATVRQILRRLTHSGEIHKIGDDYAIIPSGQRIPKTLR